ncbi:unnamed protein product [Calypogeia fissa]
MALGKACIWVTAFIIFVCDVIAFALAVAAEEHRSAATVEYDNAGGYYFCNYSSDISSSMAAGGFVALLFGHLITMSVTKCFCCEKGDLRGKGKACAIVSFIFLWLCWFIASVCFLAGANRNSIHTKTESTDILSVPLTCNMMRRGTFGAAAAFVFFSFILGEVYFLLVSFSARSASSPGTSVGWQGQAGSTMPPQQSPYAL